jgi:hypothetical protein
MPAGHGGGPSGMGTRVVIHGDDHVGGESERGGKSLPHTGSTFRKGVALTRSGSR